ncbi:MAG: hypothetical protein IPK68_10430 [Bdellovibrionales bacterium]|nr:hypothetical protein [Bdellovibrionales bacterium]
MGNDISVKFMFEMRRTALDILLTQHLTAGEGVHLILDVFELLEELSDKELPRNSFLLEAADAIRKNAHELMDARAKDLVLSGVIVVLSRDERGPQNLRHLFGVVDFLDSELRLASSEHFAFVAHHLVEFYIRRSYEFIGLKKASEPRSPNLKFGLDRIRMHLVKLIEDLLPKIESEQTRSALQRDLARLQLKYGEAKRIISSREREREQKKIGACRIVVANQK